MEHPQTIPIIRNSGNSGYMPPSSQFQPAQPVTMNIQVSSSSMPGGGQTWPGKTNNMIIPGPGQFRPMPDMNEQMKWMQQEMQRMQPPMAFPGFMGQPGMAPFPNMQPPFAPLSAPDTQPRVDNMGFFRLTPQSQNSVPGVPSGPLDIPDVVVKCKDGSTKFLLKYDVSDFKPGEVKVEITGGQLKVSGNHEEVSGNSVIKRTYHKEHPLPEGVKEDKLRSVLSPEGILTISAPVIGNPAVGAQHSMMNPHPAPMPAAIMQSYQQPSTLPRENKRKVKFCESDP